ncbi:hypothetical protein AC249_AIPGENE11180 [Exaiptasia diaphana]|nr:hypothetical protein AC249_AIPGENE11180 [Exaiptasia diaphana]
MKMLRITSRKEPLKVSFDREEIKITIADYMVPRRKEEKVQGNILRIKRFLCQEMFALIDDRCMARRLATHHFSRVNGTSTRRAAAAQRGLHVYVYEKEEEEKEEELEESEGK